MVGKVPDEDWGYDEDWGVVRGSWWERWWSHWFDTGNWMARLKSNALGKGVR